MKLECSRKDLIEAIGLVAPVASSRSPQPLFQTIRLMASENGLLLTACDGEMWAERTIAAAIEDGGAVCVQAKVLQDLVARLPDGQIKFERTSDREITMIAGASEWKLMVHDAVDFPLPSEFAASSSLTLQMGELRDAVESVAYAVADDRGRPVLTGVLFNYDGSVLTLVATDTHRLAVLKMKKDGLGSADLNAVVPEKAIKAIRNLPIADDSTLTLEFDGTRLSADAGSARVISQLLAGQYPNWERVVPAEFTRTWKMDRQELIENLNRTMILARDSANRVRFSGQDAQVVMSARSEEKGEAKEEIPAITDNGEIDIAFNAKYLLDAISAMKCDSVVAQMTESARPALFKPIEADDDRFCVIMPMALN